MLPKLRNLSFSSNFFLQFSFNFKLNKRNTYNLLLCEANETKKHLQLRKNSLQKCRTLVISIQSLLLPQNGSSRRQLGNIREEKPIPEISDETKFKKYLYLTSVLFIEFINVHIFNIDPPSAKPSANKLASEAN